MKMRYDKEDDALMVWFSNQKIDYAEQQNNLVVHFSKNNKPVLLEILDASLFLKETGKVIPCPIKHQLFA